MFGKSLFDLISDQRKQDLADSYVPGYADADALDPIADDSGVDQGDPSFHLKLRRKRQTALLKKMLTQGGDKDLARSFTVVKD